MAKRGAEGPLLHHSPSKRCCRSLYSVDMQLGRISPTTRGLSPPSLLALLGRRCRKRPHYFDDPETEEEQEGNAPAAALPLCQQATHCDTRQHAANVLMAQATGSFQERRSSGSVLTSSKKRTREEDCAAPETVVATTANEKADEDTNTEDCSYNTFQYWRVPLPELDLSLLQDTKHHSQTTEKSKVKHSTADDMET